MGYYEINGNLDEIQNYNIFSAMIGVTFQTFIETFGKEVMGKIDLYVDNATEGSGYTPITTVILKKYIIIKLGISDFSKADQIIYQFAHELCHYVFCSLKGLDHKASNLEENICSAMSLIMINKIFPELINGWEEHVSGLKDDNYNKGVIIAKEVDYDIMKLKQKIYKFCE